MKTVKGELHWRSMEASDLDGVVRVARLAFPDHFEDRQCFAERLALYPRGCFVLAGSETEVAGYLIAYPWAANSAPPLNSLIGRLPDCAEVLYLHDLALLPYVQGQGHTKIIVKRLAEEAMQDGWTAIALVAVNRAAAFWAKFAFEPAADAGMKAKLASYGDGACYMTRTLPAARI